MSRAFTLIEGLYAYVSDTDYMFDDVLWLDESFRELCNLLESHLLIFRTPEFKEIPLPVLEVPDCDTKDVVLCFSGGKDSAAAALYLKQHGYKVHLYHVHGINKAYGDEQKAAKAIAKYLGCDLFIDHIYLDGTHRFIEHPMKNYIIANGALHYAMAKGYAPRLAFGNFRKSTVDYSEFEICGGDCMEMWSAYKKIIKRIFPHFSLLIPLETNADTFDLLYNDSGLLQRAISCMSPYRFRAHWKNRTETKYGIRLLPDRCGCCWKCAVESIWMMDTKLIPGNESYYMHCMDILAKTIYKETGSKPACVEDIWDNYMFYSMRKSMYDEELEAYTIPSMSGVTVSKYIP